MYNKREILVGLVIFIVLVTFPFWFNRGKAAPVPDPKLTAEAQAAKTCIESKKTMIESHMVLLHDWRDSVVRKGNRIYHASDNKTYTMSLQNNCMTCHANKSQFCDQCHNYGNVKPYCWDCHIQPKEMTYGH